MPHAMASCMASWISANVRERRCVRDQPVLCRSAGPGLPKQRLRDPLAGVLNESTLGCVPLRGGMDVDLPLMEDATSLPEFCMKNILFVLY
jgi:nitrogen fixation protein